MWLSSNREKQGWGVKAEDLRNIVANWYLEVLSNFLRLHMQQSSVLNFWKDKGEESALLWYALTYRIWLLVFYSSLYVISHSHFVFSHFPNLLSFASWHLNGFDQAILCISEMKEKERELVAAGADNYIYHDDDNPLSVLNFDFTKLPL